MRLHACGATFGITDVATERHNCTGFSAPEHQAKTWLAYVLQLRNSTIPGLSTIWVRWAHNNTPCLAISRSADWLSQPASAAQTSTIIQEITHPVLFCTGWTFAEAATVSGVRTSQSTGSDVRC
eukprot:TRINITY_DN22744_c0_g1_i1.p1 TRINITY_DN22744_c0_g1~~TRINITY_DN22744_c0_g1_i1.p1  ORF type:complete len:124 (-),score=8.77 TRINITY_DN22744_c0_g1_i1:37-408(-)